ncbi:DNA/RNA non-specific endonuclease [Phenylobacterium kunshanense]|uniref:Endonuclease n=1 Tax=Phenylobacterium kunshanense TaxID=1445034 RepID=A0A328BNM6_9CAUL|nr:DNA/RNA non-specific endonuclease [Phenylobacterium kunshanense]RAK68597.1 DNA/RNA non-specific endonuclease [Phenylobacterium kunshanense]
MRRAASTVCIALGLALGAPAAGAVAQPAAPPPTPATGQDRAAWLQCLSRFGVIGLPSLRSEDARAEQFPTVICRQGYALSFNTRTLNPDWVIERLSPAKLRGSAARASTFPDDVALGVYSPRHGDYTGSGLDRGHQAPAANAKFDQQVMDESFYMSNMSPQVGIGFNRGQWKYLEEAVRAWVLCGGHDDVIVMTGPIYGGSDKWLTRRRILVPEAYYKIVYDVESGRAVGFRMLNRRHARSDLQTFIVPIADIEDDTGIDFFPALSRRRQNQLETPQGILWGHDQSCANVGE